MSDIIIEGFKLLNPIINFKNDNAGFYEAERIINGKVVEILWIKVDKSNESTVNRVLKDVKSTLQDRNIKNIQKFEEINQDKNNNIYYIVYESIKIGNEEFTRLDFIEILTALDTLKKRNRQGFVLDSETVVKGSDQNSNQQTNISDNCEIKIRFIGLYELFRSGILSKNEIENGKRMIEDDMLSVTNLFKNYLEKDQTGENILTQCQKRTYKKYSEILDEAEKLPWKKNPNWDCVDVTCNSNIDITELLNELNTGCYFKRCEKLSNQNQVQIQWSTKSKSGIFYVREKDRRGDVSSEKNGSFFVPFVVDSPEPEVLQEGEKFRYNFMDGMDKNDNRQIPISLTKESGNHLADATKKKKESVKKWKALPENEKKYIENNAFKAEYTGRKCDNKNKSNIIFQLANSFDDWEKIKNKKNESVTLSVNDLDIGKILDYKRNEKIITIKDCKELLKDIPESGDLVEDIRQKTSQYKKQIEACEKFSKRDIANPELSAIIANPDQYKAEYLDIDYVYFNASIFNCNIKSDNTQSEAVIKALHTEPIFLIQGPPGTGKTTVSVEIIQQFIAKNPDSKILVVSQSNTAVDNILERLPDKIKFIRLASEDAAKNEKISEKIREHTFEKKLGKWVSEVQCESNKSFKNRFKNKDTALSELYKKYSRKEIHSKEIFFKDFKTLIQEEKFKSYFEKIFESANNIAEVNKIFEDKLEKRYLNLLKIHSDWMAFINNATSTNKDGNSIVTTKYGSENVPLNIAFAKSMNVFGATCIHIASSKYASINFQFDLMMMDECSKATVAESLVPINLSKKVILIGDHKQLPPVITKEKSVREGVKDDLEDEGLDIDKQYGTSLFEQMIEEFENNDQLNLFIMLDIQYRMPRQIGNLISKFIYDGKLKNPTLEKIPNYDNEKKHNILLKKPAIKLGDEKVPNSIIAISTSHLDNPYDNDNKFERVNKTNISVIKEILNVLNELHLNKLHLKENSIPNQIGIIAAYRGQVKLLKSSITKNDYKKLDIDINTVDQFQGSEKDIILYDLVRSSKGNRLLDFLMISDELTLPFPEQKNYYLS